MLQDWPAQEEPCEMVAIWSLSQITNVTTTIDKDKTMTIEAIFEELKSKVQSLNNGILNSDNVPAHFTARQCTDMGMLSMELGSVINDLKASEGTESDIRQALRSVLDIEKRAISIARN